LSQGRYTKGLRTVQMMDDLLHNKPLARPLTHEEYMDRIIDLHPAANEHDILPNKSFDPPATIAAQCTALETQDSMYTLKRNSGNGGTGNTNLFLLGIFDDRREPGYNNESGPTDQRIALTGLFNKIMRGEYKGISRNLIIRKTVLLIPKNSDNTSSRPIGLFDCIYRLCTKMIGKIGKRIVGIKLAPHQFSLGMSSGSQISVKHSNDALTNGDTLISLDQKNAFNSTRLIDMYNGLVKYCPELIAFFRFECERAMEIEDFEVNIVGLSHTGSTQGNGAAMHMYCYAAQLIFVKIDSLVKEIKNEYKNDHPEFELRPSFVKASADDCTINGDPNIMALLAYELLDIYKAHNADLCIPKCVIFGLNLYSSDVPILAGYKQSTEV
jgi:hypothetical protein